MHLRRARTHTRGQWGLDDDDAGESNLASVADVRSSSRGCQSNGVRRSTVNRSSADCERIITLVLGGLYIQAVYQSNRGFMQGTMLLRMLTAVIFWGNGLQWRLAALVEAGLAFLSGLGLVLESRDAQRKSRRRRP